jgi:hypothetical protein
MVHNESALSFLQLGFTHVLPLGLDHILFILTLYFLNPTFKSIVIQCSLFTLAHSITLALVAGGVFLPNPHVVEPLIALTIFFTAIQNIVKEKVQAGRMIVVFAFGLIHGMGFAAAFREIDLKSMSLFSSILFFNVGVELAQISVVVLAYLLIGKWFSKKSWYRTGIVYPVSSVIAGIAVFWFVERIFY